MEPELKRRKSEDDDERVSLDDDILRAILLRTFASDHSNLRKSGRRIRNILDSYSFRKERGESGYAQVQVELLTPFEQYQEEYRREAEESDRVLRRTDSDFQDEYDNLGRKGEENETVLTETSFRILVDEITIKENVNIRMRLLPRLKGFHGRCDAISAELESMSVSLFTDKGQPLITSLKKALKLSKDNKKPLLYISEFELPDEYRSLDSLVAPEILRSILTQPALKDEWSLAIYTPYCEAQIAGSEAKEFHNRHRVQNLREPTAQELADEMRKRQRYEELTLQDMRQFFRVGFHQIKEQSVVNENTNFYVYVTLKDLQANPIRTKSQVLDMEIALPASELSTAESVGAEQLLALMRRHAPEVNNHLSVISKLQKSLPEQNRLIAECEDKMATCRAQLVERQSELSFLREVWADLADEDGSFDTAIRRLERSPVSVSFTGSIRSIASQNSRRAFGEMERELEDIIRETSKKLAEVTRILTDITHTSEAQISEANRELATKVAEIQNQISTILGNCQNPRQVVLQSNAFHACVFNLAKPILDILLDYLPDIDSKSAIINRLDQFGCTPLMIAAKTTGYRLGDDRGRKMIQFLLDLGADKDIIRSDDGLSCLGLFRKHYNQARTRDEEWLDMDSEIVRERARLAREEARRVEILLTPYRGATPADKALNPRNDDEVDDL